MKDLLEKIEKAFKQNQVNKLKQVSNEALDKAVIENKKELIPISITAYSLYKILTKKHYYTSSKWTDFKKHVQKHLKECIENPEEAAQILEKKLMQDILSLDEEHSHFSQDLIDKARVKQASRAYAMGVSLETAIELTQANRFQVYEYVGRTKIHDHMPAKNVSRRYFKAKKALGGEE